MARKVLITGATGDTGRAAVAEAIALGLSVRAMVRRVDDRSISLEALGAEIVVGDLLEIDTVVSAMKGVDAAYFVWPVAPGHLNAAVNFAQAAKETGVTHIVNLSQRSADRHSKSNDSRDHFLAERVFDWSGVPVTHLRPTLFLEWLLYPFQLPYIQQGVLRIPAGKGRHAPIAAEDQGRVIAAILADPAPHAGKTYPLFGPVEMDHTQFAAELSEALGRPIVFQDLPIEAYNASLQTMGVPAYVLQHFAGAMDAYQHGVMSGMNHEVEALTGRVPMSVGDFARAHADILNPVHA